MFSGWCRRSVKEADPNAGKIADMFMRMNFVCPTCGRRECPHAEDRNNPCTSMIFGPNAWKKQN